MDTDPRSLVEAPVRGALVGLMGRGFALVGVMALLAAWPLVTHATDPVRESVAALALAVLAGYGGWVRLTGWMRGRPDEAERARAWERAREIDGDDAALGLLVAGWVPVGLVLALGLLLWPGITHPVPLKASAWIVLAVPPFALGWLVAVTAWLDSCRDDLARAEREADVRLRRYWANVGR